jgi:hypothetical protein
MEGFKDYPEEFAVLPELIISRDNRPPNPRARRR